MNKTEKAYIAGFIDGEGTITLLKKHRNETPSPHVTISNCNLAILKWIRHKVGRGEIQKKKRFKNHHSAAFELRIRGNHALEFLEKIGHYLQIKRRQADLLIRQYKLVTVRNGRYSPVLLAKKMKLVGTIKRLNQRPICTPYNTPGSPKKGMKR